MSPKLLQLSGVGPAGHLESVGVRVVRDSPNVGTGMREHLAISLPYRLEGSDPGLNRRYRGVGLIPGFVQYYATHTGPMATGPFEVGAFARTVPEVDRPDMQLYLSAYSRVGKGYRPERLPGLTIYGQLIRPTSVGSLRINSADPDAVLSITPNWLSTQEDCAAAVAMVRYMRRYVRQDALRGLTGKELAPGDEHQSDAEILRVFRRTSTSGLHGVASCALGRDDSSVLDERLRVRGVVGLRVADCSAMPGLISGNTSGPAMALGWRAASLLLEDEKAGAVGAPRRAAAGGIR
jgi:choline dehydrogenase